MRRGTPPPPPVSAESKGTRIPLVVVKRGSSTLLSNCWFLSKLLLFTGAAETLISSILRTRERRTVELMDGSCFTKRRTRRGLFARVNLGRHV